MAKITNFTVTAVNADNGNITIVGNFNFVGGAIEEFRMVVNEDNTIGYMTEKVKQEMKRRNKVDDLAISMQSIVGAVVTP